MAEECRFETLVSRSGMRAIAIAAIVFGCASPLKAAQGICGFVENIPRNSTEFETVAQQVDQLGCDRQKTESAHSFSWKCHQGGKQRTIGLDRLTEGPDAGTIVYSIFGQDLTSLNELRACAGGQPTTSFDHAFTSESILVRDRIDVRNGFRSSALILLGLFDFGVAVTTVPANKVTLMEQAVFGVRRPFYASTKIEVAGRNVVQTSFDSILRALIGRGSTLVERKGNYPNITALLTAPIGLEGVQSVEVTSAGLATLSVVYSVPKEADYQTYIDLLDGKYGRSRAVTGTSGHMKGCRLRSWQSGDAQIVGTFCSGKSAELNIYNNIAVQQMSAVLQSLERDAPAESKKIDLDNL